MFIAVTLFLPQGIVGLCAASVRAPERRERRVMTPDLMQAGARRRAARRERAGARRGQRRAAATRATARVVEPDELDIAHGAILYLDDITVSFDGFKALNALSLTISAGELRCIIGPNGAGKTTMMDVITGKTRPDAGQRLLRLDDRPAAPARERDRVGRHRPQVPEADGVRAPHRCSRTSSSR